MWVNYALREEMKNKDIERTRQVYKACLDLLPHKLFTFRKIWLYFAHFEVRQKNLPAARKILVSVHFRNASSCSALTSCCCA